MSGVPGRGRTVVKFFPLIVANLFRKKTRTILTIGSFVAALFLFALLATIDASFTGGVEIAGADRLVVLNKMSIIQPLPIPIGTVSSRFPM